MAWAKKHRQWTASGNGQGASEGEEQEQRYGSHGRQGPRQATWQGVPARRPEMNSVDFASIRNKCPL